MSDMDFLDDFVFGPVDILDKLDAWLTLAFAPASRKRQPHSRFAFETISIPRSDKRAGPSLNEVIDYLAKFGVVAVRSGFDSRSMYFQVRRNQKRWVDLLLDVDADGIPRLDYARKSWKESK